MNKKIKAVFFAFGTILTTSYATTQLIKTQLFDKNRTSDVSALNLIKNNTLNPIKTIDDKSNIALSTFDELQNKIIKRPIFSWLKKNGKDTFDWKSPIETKNINNKKIFILKIRNFNPAFFDVSIISNPENLWAKLKISKKRIYI